LAESTRLFSHAKQKVDHVDELKLRLEEQKEEVQNVRDTLTQAAKADNDISRQLQKLNNREGKASYMSYLVCLMHYCKNFEGSRGHMEGVIHLDILKLILLLCL
jgi:FtsZ-binding cell division protein ZapB